MSKRVIMIYNGSAVFRVADLSYAYYDSETHSTNIHLYNGDVISIKGDFVAQVGKEVERNESDKRERVCKLTAKTTKEGK